MRLCDPRPGHFIEPRSFNTFHLRTEPHLENNISSASILSQISKAVKEMVRKVNDVNSNTVCGQLRSEPKLILTGCTDPGNTNLTHTQVQSTFKLESWYQAIVHCNAKCYKVVDFPHFYRPFLVQFNPWAVSMLRTMPLSSNKRRKSKLDIHRDNSYLLTAKKGCWKP